MVKTKQQHSRRPRASKRDDHVRIRSKFVQTSAVNTSSLVNSLGNIGTASGTGILANDLNLQNLTDMFRLYRINSITFEWDPATAASAGAYQIPAGFLGFVPFGAASSPTSQQDFETEHISKLTVPFGTNTQTAPLTRECGTKLTLKNEDMPVLQGPGGGWLATQDDGTQGYFGKLFWAIASVTASNAINYLLSTTFDISFKDLLDPSLISLKAPLYPSGFPACWDIADNTPLAHWHMALSSAPIPRLLPAEDGTAGDTRSDPLGKTPTARRGLAPPGNGDTGDLGRPLVRGLPWRF